MWMDVGEPEVSGGDNCHREECGRARLSWLKDYLLFPVRESAFFKVHV
jgi:hypothetical protein